jgi:hypothetical protein
MSGLEEVSKEGEREFLDDQAVENIRHKNWLVYDMDTGNYYQVSDDGLSRDIVSDDESGFLFDPFPEVKFITINWST